jgi:AAA+ superfamily predicted ATPase
MWFWKKRKHDIILVPKQLENKPETETSTPNSEKMEDNDNYVYSEEEEPQSEFDYLEKLIMYRVENYFHPGRKKEAPPDIFKIKKWHLPLINFIMQHRLSAEEAAILLIAIVPHVKPNLFDEAIESRMPPQDPQKPPVVFAQIGGVRGNNSRFFLPTGETVLFLLAFDDLEKRLEIQQFFGAEHIFWEKKMLWLEDMQNGEPAMHGRLIVSPDYADLFIHGTHKSPQFSISFPAKKIAPVKDKALQTPPTFNDLVIPEELKEQIKELESWITYNEELMNKYGMKNKLKKGYRTLFYGPPGTGKTYTAEILGNHLGKEVFKIDLSMVVSKYIGETEKNLELLFARAEDKGWILFFDEADALFGKRTNVRDAHDKYANQEVSYLLQRIEDYNGLVILATNMKNNIDDAFLRRFNSILKFPFPDPAQRAQIWKKVLPKDAVYRKKMLSGDPPDLKELDADIPEAVKKYELTGGNIINVVQYACIKAIDALYKKEKEIKQESPQLVGSNVIVYLPSDNKSQEKEEPLVIYLGDVLDGIKRELIKEGKPFSL